MKIDMYEFMSCLEDVYEQCNSEEEIEIITNKMINYISSKSMIAKQYLKLNIL